MTKGVSIDNLAAEITMAVKNYTDDVALEIDKEVDSTSKTVLKDIRDGSPVKTGAYKKGWKRKLERRLGTTSVTIHNAAKGWLAHILEFGHAIRTGGRVPGKPHIIPAYDRHVPAMEESIKRIIRGGGGGA